MKVYVVTYQKASDRIFRVVGVFSSRARAREWIETFGSAGHHIEEFLTDEPSEYL